MRISNNKYIADEQLAEVREKIKMRRLTNDKQKWMVIFNDLYRIGNWRLQIINTSPIIPVGLPVGFVYWPSPAPSCYYSLMSEVSAIASYKNEEVVEHKEFRDPWDGVIRDFKTMVASGVVEFADGFWCKTSDIPYYASMYQVANTNDYYPTKPFIDRYQEPQEYSGFEWTTPQKREGVILR